MTDTGAVFRAIKIGYPDKITAETLGLTISTLTLLKEEFEEIKKVHTQGIPWYDAANLLMKNKGEVWYAYHCLESSEDDLKAEIIAEKEGTARIETPETPVVPDENEDIEKAGTEKPEKTEKKKGPKKKEVKEIKKEKIDVALEEEAGKHSGMALMEDAGTIGKELAIKRQELGKFVIDSMDGPAREFGYADLKEFLGLIYNFYVENYGIIEQKNGQINQLSEANNQLITALDERTRKAFISKAIDAHVFETIRRGMTVKPENLLAYSQYLDSYLRPISTENLIKLQPGEILNGIKAAQ